MARTKVANKSNTKEGIYIGRGSLFGNPFSTKKSKYPTILVGTREEAINSYKEWLNGKHPEVEPERRELLLKNIHKLKGETLLCFCKPLACHGDILVELLENE